jgi:hypothetical protein
MMWPIPADTHMTRIGKVPHGGSHKTRPEPLDDEALLAIPVQGGGCRQQLSMVGAQPIGPAFERIVDNDQLEIAPCPSSKIEQPTGSSDRWPDGKSGSAGGTLHLC